MESYNWKKLNNKVCFVDIKKKFFNKYFYSIKYFCPGGRIILQPYNNNLEAILNSVATRRLRELTFQSRLFSPWYTPMDDQYLRDKQKIIPQQLYDVLTVKNKYKDTIKIRIEEPFVTLYAEDEKSLLNIAKHELTYWNDRLENVSRPESDDIKNLLENNCILIKKDIGFKYKFICKEGPYKNKSALYSYLTQLEDNVKISKTNWTQLESTHSYIRNLCIYANELDLAAMLNIIEVTAVRNIHELIVAPTK